MQSRDIVRHTLRRLMAERQLTQMKLGSDAKVTQSTVGRILGGSLSTTLDTLDAIAKALDMEPWQLICPHAELQTREGLAIIRTAQEVMRATSRTEPVTSRTVSAVGRGQDTSHVALNQTYRRSPRVTNKLKTRR